MEYPSQGITLVGVDPLGEKMREYYPPHIHLIADFFGKAALEKRFGSKKAKIITSIAMFYDLESPLAFMQQVYELLADDGVWVFEQSYMPTMLANNSYDTVCHEHLEYYSLATLEYLLARHGLQIIDAELNDANGGSIRTYIKRIGSVIPKPLPGAKNRLNNLRRVEHSMGLHRRTAYLSFARRVNAIKKKLFSFIATKVKQGKKLLHIFSVSNNSLAFRLELDTETLFWTLQEVSDGLAS